MEIIETVIDDRMIRVIFQSALIPLTVTDEATDDDDDDDKGGEIVVESLMLLSLYRAQSEKRFLQCRLYVDSGMIDWAKYF